MLALASVVLSACIDKTTGPPATTQVLITPATAQHFTSLGETSHLSAEPRDASGQTTQAEIAWSSSDDAVATVADDGTVTAVGNGNATITASADGASASVSVTVQQVIAQTTRMAGEAQSDTVRAALPIELEVRLTDAGGSPVAGQPLEFLASSGGSVDDATTGDDGRATTTWLLGDTAGTQTVDVVLPGTTTPLATFTATATAGAAAAITLVSGSGQAGYAGIALPEPLVVRAVDAYGNARDGVVVDFAVTGGGGSVTPARDTTNADGMAAASWTLGPDTTDQEVTIFAPGLGLALQVTAVADVSSGLEPGRSIYLAAPSTARPGDTIRVHVTTSLEALLPETWGAIVGFLSWDDTVLALSDLFQVEGDLTQAVTYIDAAFGFSVSRPRNDLAVGTPLTAEFVVLPGASGTTEIELLLDALVSAGTFNDLAAEVSVAGSTVEIGQ